MTAIPHAAVALTSALDRFGQASPRLLEAVTGGDDAAMADAFVEMTEAKAQLKAGIALVRFSDEMFSALLEIAREPRQP